ncbi:hypothetical protein E4U53_004174 [Claviceps sorghi]|nr:hypothetical protein E4U53_004174 [Claviceps sorghi]
MEMFSVGGDAFDQESLRDGGKVHGTRDKRREAGRTMGFQARGEKRAAGYTMPFGARERQPGKGPAGTVNEGDASVDSAKKGRIRRADARGGGIVDGRDDERGASTRNKDVLCCVARDRAMDASRRVPCRHQMATRACRLEEKPLQKCLPPSNINGDSSESMTQRPNTNARMLAVPK